MIYDDKTVQIVYYIRSRLTSTTFGRAIKKYNDDICCIIIVFYETSNKYTTILLSGLKLDVSPITMQCIHSDENSNIRLHDLLNY